jgi:hypothetical protein
LPVSGRWSIGRDTTLTIRSVLADESDARSTVMTLLSEEPFFRWLLMTKMKSVAISERKAIAFNPGWA